MADETPDKTIHGPRLPQGLVEQIDHLWAARRASGVKETKSSLAGEVVREGLIRVWRKTAAPSAPRSVSQA